MEMIVYDRIVNMNGRLELMCSINPEYKSTYYKDIKITGIRFDNILTYNKKDALHEVFGTSQTFHTVQPMSILDKDFLIITPVIEGTFAPNTPCGYDVVNKAVIYNKDLLKSRGLGYLKEFGDNCTVPKGFIDFILKRKAFELALDSCNYNLVIKYWKWLTLNTKSVIKGGCGCNG